MDELSKVYQPKEVEPKWNTAWEKAGCFAPKIDSSKKPYTIVIPPPNVTGILHMGHALNNTIQDILIRWKRMQGVPTLWVPGTDHAGIATQNVVEKSLANEKKTRHDLGREAFVKRVWAWKEEYGGTIVRQLKRLGASCDWSRERFTMDEGLSDAVKEVFVRLFEKGLIYRGDYIINWCPRCETALSDEEAPHQELQGHLWYIRYPIEGGIKSPQKGLNPYVVVATTRPETLLGDTGIAVNPKDERYRFLVGKTVLLPILKRKLKVIEDEFVDPAFGTGAVKVTPAHDPNDFVMGQKHGLPPVNVMHPNGTMNEQAGPYKGLDRFECRKRIVADLEKEGLLEKIALHLHAVGHCYRCHTAVEPRLSRQWFVKMKPLAEPAIRVVKEGKVRFHPERWTKVYLEWMENIRDWCISRQIWWGHRIPAWYCVGTVACKVKECKEPIVSRETPKSCPACGSTNLRQDEDVLDTWFSSWLWPFSTLGWPEKTRDLTYFYPTQTLVTAQEIIFFWVARMIMAGIEFMGKEPFSDVVIHGTVRVEGGKKMSKSLGNVIDPLEIIEQFGADALRFSIIFLAAQDVYLSNEKFQVGRNFANKIWNAARLILPRLGDKDERGRVATLSLGPSDRWILSRLQRTIQDVTHSLEEFRFNEGANLLYEFFWHEFCDWYLEISKTRPDAEVAPILHEVLETSLRLLHPWMPFVTEELWQRLPGAKGSLLAAPWPMAELKRLDSPSEKTMNFVMSLSTEIRNLRFEWHVPPTTELDAKLHESQLPQTLIEFLPFLFLKEKVKIHFVKDTRKPKGSATLIVDNHPCHVVLEGVIDLEKEKARILTEIEQRKGHHQKTKARLSDQAFLSRAPEEIVQKTRESLKTVEEEIQKLGQALSELT